MERLGQDEQYDQTAGNGTDNGYGEAANVLKNVKPSEHRIGFGGGNIGLVKGQNAIEVAKKMNELLQNTNMVAIPLEASAYSMDYSAVILTSKIDGKVFYWVGALKNTGPLPLSIGTVLENDRNNANSFVKSKSPVYAVNDVMFTKEYIEVAEKLIKQKYGSEVEPIIIDNTVVNYGIDDVELFTNSAYQSLVGALAINEHGDLSLVDEAAAYKQRNNIKNNDNTKPQIKVSYRNIDPKEMIKDDGGNVVRADFELSINLEENNVAVGVNTGNGNNHIGKVYGYLDFTPDFVPASMTPGIGSVAEKVVKFKPNIIITNIKMESKTLGYAIFGITCSLCMVNRDNLLGHIVHNKTNLGALNLVVNYENNQDGLGSHIDLSSLGKNELIQALDKLIYVRETNVILDIAKNTHGYLDPLIESINGDTEALETIKETIKDLVGKRPSFNSLFKGSRILPYVTWEQDNKTIDGREVEMAWLLENTKDISKYAAYNEAINAHSNATKGILDLLASLDITEGSYEASIIRLVFDPAVINSLQSAILSIVDVRDESKFSFNESLNYGSSWLSGIGGISTANDAFKQPVGGFGVNSFAGNPFN